MFRSRLLLYSRAPFLFTEAEAQRGVDEAETKVHSQKKKLNFYLACIKKFRVTSQPNKISFIVPHLCEARVSEQKNVIRQQHEIYRATENTGIDVLDIVKKEYFRDIPKSVRNKIMESDLNPVSSRQLDEVHRTYRRGSCL